MNKFEEREKGLLNQILNRKNEIRPVVCLHILDQDLVTAMSTIIIHLAQKLDENNISY